MRKQIIQLYEAGWRDDRIAAQLQVHTSLVRDIIEGVYVSDEEIKKKAVADAAE